MEKQILKINRLLILTMVMLMMLCVSEIFRAITIQEPVKYYCGVTGASDVVTGRVDSSLAKLAGIFQNRTGKSLFVTQCAMCHRIDGILVGPALYNVHQRRTEEWLYKFITNATQIIGEGDTIAVKLFEQYGRTEMPDFALSRSEVDSLLAFIRFESAIRE